MKKEKTIKTSIDITNKEIKPGDYVVGSNGSVESMQVLKVEKASYSMSGCVSTISKDGRKKTYACPNRSLKLISKEEGEEYFGDWELEKLYSKTNKEISFEEYKRKINFEKSLSNELGL